MQEKKEEIEIGKYVLELIEKDTLNTNRPDSEIIKNILEVIRYLLLSKQIKIK